MILFDRGSLRAAVALGEVYIDDPEGQLGAVFQLPLMMPPRRPRSARVRPH